MAGSALMRSALAGFTVHAGMAGEMLPKEPFVARCRLQVRHVRGEFEKVLNQAAAKGGSSPLVAVASRWLLRTSETATAAQEQSAPQKIGRPGVPVLAGTAEVKDVPIIVRGIGSVQACNMVTVKSRVDGNIVKVAFTEGQYVHQGDG
jgi:multidrug efflux pump subunit AcrA (membrane-fusion protein)